MVEIDTYFRINNEFVLIEEFSNQFSDIDYIEGAIILKINSVTILSLETWDYIDQLWAYIINGLETIMLKENYFTYFPDQAIGFSLETKGKDLVKVSIDYDNGRSAVISKNDFILCICEEGRKFFNKMLNLVPSYKSSWVEYIDKINKIEKQLIHN